MESRSDGGARQKSAQELPKDRGREGMARQGISKENGKRAAAASAPTAVGAVDPLTTDDPLSGLGWVVALE